MRDKQGRPLLVEVDFAELELKAAADRDWETPMSIVTGKPVM